MKKEIKKLWVEALRSGKYQQGRGELRCDDTFCCLGVLCDLHAKATGMAWEDKCRYLGQVGTLPDDVLDWSGLPDKNPLIAGRRLSVHNDGWKRNRAPEQRAKKFPRIADLIEKHL